MQDFSTFLRMLRRQKAWSQQQVADKMDISVPAFSKLENGLTDISLSRLEQLSDIYGISLVSLLSCGADSNHQQSDQLERVKQQLQARELEILQLQSKLIRLYEELNSVPAQGLDGNGTLRVESK